MDEQIDNIVQQMGSFPNEVTIAPMQSSVIVSGISDQQTAIEQMSNGAGPSAEVTALTSQIETMTNNRTALVKRRDEAQSNYDAQIGGWRNRDKNWSSCTYRGATASVNKKYKCDDDYHGAAWQSEERAAIDAGLTLMNNYLAIVADSEKQIADIDNKLPQLKADLINLRESVTKSNLTPAERIAYDQSQADAKAKDTQAAALAEATVRTAETTASAKSKRIIFYAVAGSVALVAGVVLYFVFRKKGGSVAPRVPNPAQV